MEKEEIRSRLMAAGAVAVGFARAEAVPGGVTEEYTRWMAAGRHAGMGYMERHAPLRRDPREVMPGARTVIVAAFSYKPRPEECRPAELPEISSYAWGDDYHDVIRRRLTEACRPLMPEYRICVDSAPVHERYWARRAGIGYIADNGALTVPGYGNMVFLAEILTEADIEPDMEAPITAGCLHCGACRRACPADALQHDRTVDCRRCLSYLTIEHRGEWESGEMRFAMSTPAGKETLYGCDRCLRACPLSREAPPSGIEEFRIRDAIRTLDRDAVTAMTPLEFSETFRSSAIKRAKLPGLLRNARNSIS